MPEPVLCPCGGILRPPEYLEDLYVSLAGRDGARGVRSLAFTPDYECDRCHKMVAATKCVTCRGLGGEGYDGIGGRCVPCPNCDGLGWLP